MSHTLVAIGVPEAEELVRRGLGRAAAGAGPDEVLAHITVLGPFLPEDQVTDRIRADLRSCFSRIPPFDFVLGPPRTFPGGVVHLPPVPAAPFEEMTRALFERYPSCPPYGGAFDEVVAHLSIGAGGDEASARSLLEAGRSAAPLACRATHARLYRFDETLQTIDVLPLGEAA